jgi:hypothetical protein
VLENITLKPCRGIGQRHSKGKLRSSQKCAAALPCTGTQSRFVRGYEKLVTRHLEHQGLNHFLPVYRSVRRWKDRRKELDMALFPGYVFVKLKLGDRLRVLRAPGAVQFVTFRGQPAAIPDSEIRALESSHGQRACGRNLIPTCCQGSESPPQARAAGGGGGNHDPPQRTLPAWCSRSI